MQDIINRLRQYGLKLRDRKIKDLLVNQPRRHLFRLGNTKLSRKILSFGLPAVMTCPGKTEACSGGTNPPCYATRGLFRMESVSLPRMENFVIGHRKDFHKLLEHDLCFFNPNRVVRIHDSGDFFDPEYTEQWFKLCKRNKQRKFYFYTRSWRIKPIFKVLQKFNSLRNVRVWYSVDADTGKPPVMADNVRLCWFQRTEQDVADYPVDLVFRDRKLRKKKKIRENGSLICPFENGVLVEKRFDCFQCKICWNDLELLDSRDFVEWKGRVSLPLL